MSDIKIPGVNSDTTLMVDKLMEVERIPLKKLETELEQFGEERKVWLSLGRTTTELQNSAKNLYGFQNPFSEHISESSKPEVITATASRSASIDEIDMIVKQKASGDRFISQSLPINYRVPAGDYSFRIGDEDINLRYRGGKLDDFVKRLNNKDETLLKASVIRNRSDSQVLLIESVKTGSSNSLFFLEDSIQFGLDTQLIKHASGESGEISISPDRIRNWETIENSDKYEFINNDLIVKNGASLTLPLDSPMETAAGATLEIEYYVNSIPESDFKTPPPPGPDIPAPPGISYEGISIDSSTYAFNTPSWEEPTPPARIDDMNVFFAETDSGIITLPPIEDHLNLQKVKIPLEADSNVINALNIRNNNNYREIVIHSAKITNPSLRGEYEAVDPLNNASDAIILMNGIEIVRETNKIDDLIPGLTLNIHSSSSDNVTLSIKPDTEQAKDQLINFVFRYNEMMTRLGILTNSDTSNTAIIDEKENYTTEERDESIKQLGLFRGEYSLIRLKSALQTIVSSPYETSAGKDLILMKQLGISTNETSSGGGAYNASRFRGYLEINEEVLDEALNDKQEAIKELFGMDTDGDLIIDSGIGIKLSEQLNAYTQTGGYFSTKVSSIDYDIDGKTDDISDYKDRLETYEANLRRKYGNMETMLNQLESSGSSIESFNNQNSNK